MKHLEKNSCFSLRVAYLKDCIMSSLLKYYRFRVDEGGTVSESQTTRECIGHGILVLADSIITLSKEE